jgi:NTE family protein
MNQKQLYITMLLLMVLWLILQRGAWLNPKEETVFRGAPPMVVYRGAANQHSNIDSEKVYPVGLALGGGGIKCLCQAGVLKAMEEDNIWPDIISGVSAGGVVAALYSDGYSPDSIVSLFKNVNYTDFFYLEIPKGGLLSLTGFKAFLNKMLHAKTFEELKIPLRIVATDLDNGRSVVFDKGSLVDALMASCSVPVLFGPYKIDGVNYVDGGLLQNLPVSVLRSDCRFLVGASVGPMDTEPYEKSITNIALRSYKFIFRSNANYDRGLCDVLIEPKGVNKFNGADINHIQEIYDLGYGEAKKMLQNRKVKNVSK